MNASERIRISQSALLGLAVGDAFGVPVEFMAREEVRALNLREMVGKDTPCTFNSRWSATIPAGAWSDDTSMTLAAMDSIIRCGGKIDWEDVMRRFENWWNRGEYTCLSFPFGLGNNVDNALYRFAKGVPALKCGGRSELDNGNGALMRILPFSLHCIFRGLDLDRTAEIVGNGSALTHGHDTSRMCCLIYTEFMRGLLAGMSKEDALARVRSIDYARFYSPAALTACRRVISEDFLTIRDADIHPTGYVVDSLEGALYAVLHGTDYEDTVLSAVHLGYDTDTVGAIAGSLAGAMYDMAAIPARWLDKLRSREMLEAAAEKFAVIDC